MVEALKDDAELWGKYRQFQRALISYNDFQQAVAVSQIILEKKLHDTYPREDRLLLEALNLAMVVAYCRPFSGNDARSDSKVPDLPGRFLRGLTEEELEIHRVALEDRNTALAHSDSDAWNMTPQYLESGDRKILIPSHTGVHRPLLREPTARLGKLAEKMREACFEERTRLEAELKPYLPTVEIPPVVQAEVDSRPSGRAASSHRWGGAAPDACTRLREFVELSKDIRCLAGRM